MEYALQRVTGTFIVRFTNHPTDQITLPHPKLELEEYLKKKAFYNRNILYFIELLIVNLSVFFWGKYIFVSYVNNNSICWY